MGAFGGLILTNKGRALQVKAQAGTQLNFNRIAVGDGSLGGQSITNLNALISEKKSLAISKLKTQSTDKAVVGTVLSNQDIVTGFYLRELGVFAQDPDEGEILFCYGNAGAGAEYIPAGGGADIVEKAIDVVTIVGNASNVTATIDESLVFATVDHTHGEATPLVAGFMSVADKSKLDGVEAGATNYQHPATHPPLIIAQDVNNRFSSDAEKVGWDAKETPTGAQTKADTAEANAKSYADATFETPTGAQAKADAAAQSVQDDVDAHKADVATYNFQQFDKNADTGIYARFEEYRVDATLFRKTILSNLDVNNFPQTETQERYDTDGVTVINTKTFSLIFDADGILTQRNEV